MLFRTMAVKKQIQDKMDLLQKRIESYERQVDDYNDLIRKEEDKIQHTFSVSEARKIEEKLDYYRWEREYYWNKRNLVREKQDGMRLALDYLTGKIK